MSETEYKRVDVERPLEQGATTPSGRLLLPAEETAARVRLWLVLPLSLLLSLTQAVLTVFGETYRHIYPSSTMIPVLGFGLIVLLVLAINPALRFVGRLASRAGREADPPWPGNGPENQAGTSPAPPPSKPSPKPLSPLWYGPLNRAELICVISTLLVTAGISSYGLIDQLIPIVAAPWNPEWNTPQAGWDVQLLPHMNEKLFITDPEAVRTFREGLGVKQVGMAQPPESAPFSKHLQYYALVFKAVPWRTWLGPLAYWAIFVAGCYGLFYSLTYIVLSYWSNREKLIFPLAKLPEAIVQEPDEPESWVPRIFRTGGFWIGFALAFLVMSWNAAVAADFITGIGKIPLGMHAQRVNEVLTGSFLQGMTSSYWGPLPLCFVIVFTTVGIAFLLPTEVSFSAWFYFLLGKTLLLIGVWMGYGKTTDDFPTDWIWSNNAVSAQGAGAMLVFSAISLARSIRQYFTYAAGKSRSERIQLMRPVIGLAVCIVILTAWLYWCNLGLIFSLVIVSFLTLITLGFMRIVAEGGIYWFQSHVSIFHITSIFGLGKFISPVTIGILLPIYSVLFLDIKTFMPPSMLNAAKMQDDTKAEKRGFHINMIVTLAATVIVAVGLMLFLCYLRGGQQMSDWFFSGCPRTVMGTAYSIATTPPKFDFAKAGWYVVGGLWVTASIIIRRTLFWFPHPIGYIMLVNPLMSRLWFSMFLGWIAKKIVVKYGGKTTFDKVRVVFIGLIIGELMSIFIWNIASLIWRFDIPGVDLNRYHP